MSFVYGEIEDPSQLKEFAPVGRCIYCRSTTNLRMEHIVPEGLGGNFELYGASCADCEKITSYIEGANLRQIFYHARTRLGLLNRKRKRDHPTHFVAQVDFGGRLRPRHIPIARFPTTIIMPRYPPPSLPFGEDPAKSLLVVLAVGVLPTKEGQFDPFAGNKITVTNHINFVAYDRMLAKIGHAYTVAKLGLDGFQPLLTDFILGGHDGDDRDVMRHAIGGELASREPGKSLHEISIQNWNSYAVVKLSLFSNFGMPTHYIVTGLLA